MVNRAKENGQPGLFLVDLNGPGVARETLKTLDPTRGAAKLTFTGETTDPQLRREFALMRAASFLGASSAREPRG